MGHADGFVVDCMENCKNCMIFIMLNLVVFKEERGKKKARRKNINISELTMNLHYHRCRHPAIGCEKHWEVRVCG